MARLLWLADVLRGAGLNVSELDGWTKSGTERINPRGIVCHHTATRASASDAAVAKLLRIGRTDLKGPLCHLGLQRDGIWVVIAAGRANHNGFGEWGNDSIGVEAYNDGVGEPWPTVQTDSYAQGCAALAKHLGIGPERVKGHKETDPGRKIDPTFDMAGFRVDVAHYLEPTTPPPPGEDDMTPAIVRDNLGRRWVFATGLDAALWYKVDDDPWAKANIAGTLTSGPDAVANDDGTIEIVGRGADGSLSLTVWNGAVFLPWAPLGGQTR